MRKLSLIHNGKRIVYTDGFKQNSYLYIKAKAMHLFKCCFKGADFAFLFVVKRNVEVAIPYAICAGGTYIIQKTTAVQYRFLSGNCLPQEYFWFCILQDLQTVHQLQV